MTSTKPEDDVFKGVFSQQSFNFSLKQLSNWRALYCSNDLLLQKKERLFGRYLLLDAKDIDSETDIVLLEKMGVKY